MTNLLRDRKSADEFVWFIGRVENRDDPLQVGCVQVRCFGFHGMSIDAKDLPWAHVLQSTESSGVWGFGRSPNGLAVESWVVGFFADGKRAQEPIVIGSLPDMPISALATGTDTEQYDPDQSIGEPPSSYAAKYPLNNVYQTESGHFKEYDDTDGHERIREHHTSGTQYEIHPNGDKVVRVVGDGYEVIAGNNSVKVSGNVKLIVDGDLDMSVGGACNISSGGNMRLQAPRIDLNED